ncbi:MAG: DedA family protein [Gammaproteobacteria bacterium]|nr:MAG: DedA family protein [Gammaproteobacteria bacterium]
MTESLYWAVFSSGLLSSTLLPGNSEVMLGGSIIHSPDQAGILVLLATAGNTIGGLISLGMGRLIAIRYPASRLTSPSQQKALQITRKWGAAALLLSWVPVIGDPLCVAAGWIRTGIVLSILFIIIGKLGRYLVIMSLLS